MPANVHKVFISQAQASSSTNSSNACIHLCIYLFIPIRIIFEAIKLTKAPLCVCAHFVLVHYKLLTYMRCKLNNKFWNITHTAAAGGGGGVGVSVCYWLLFCCSKCQICLESMIVADFQAYFNVPPHETQSLCWFPIPIKTVWTQRILCWNGHWQRWQYHCQWHSSLVLSILRLGDSPMWPMMVMMMIWLNLYFHFHANLYAPFSLSLGCVLFD